MYLGDYDTSSTVDFKFTTRSSTGLPTTFSGSPAVRVYKTNNTTETSNGVSLTVDFDGVTGCNHVRITLSSDVTFYSGSSDFAVVITAGTVGGVSVVGEVVAAFSIHHRSPLRPVSIGQRLAVDGLGICDAQMVRVGPSGSGTAQTARDLGLALPVAAPNTNGGLPVLSVGGTTLDYTLSTVSVVNGLGTAAITATSIATDAITAAKLAADVATELQAGLATAAALSTLTGYVDSEVNAIKSVTDQLATTIELDGSVYRFTTNALEQGGSGGSSTVYVYPLTSTLPPTAIFSSGTTQGFQFTPLPSGPIAIFDANDTPINLAGAVLQMILTRTTEPTDIVTLTSGAAELTVGGADSNQVSVDYTPTFAGEYEWKLYRQEINPDDWTVLAIGFWNIEVGEDPA